jgi:hypothetical protein
MAPIPIWFWFAPLWLAFEAVQLVLSERHIGVKQMARGGDPRESGPGEAVAFCWVLAIVLYWAWMLVMATSRFSRAQALCMLGVSLVGAAMRRLLGLKWCLVILTLEGAIRIGMIISLFGAFWRHR